MNNLLFYFLQVIVCSGILCVYYIAVLSNKKFHQYNRFYLLGAAIISWVIPFIKIPIATPILNSQPNTTIPLYAIIASSNSSIEQTVQQKSFLFSANTLLIFGYTIVCCILLIGFIHALYKIYALLKTHSYKQFNNVYLVLTKAKGTPFSFFKFIFWNTEIDLQTPTGKQILQHELTHINEKHSTDKILLQINTIVGWFNPFFWYIKKEVYMIHEFIADNKTVAEGDAATLAKMLLTAAYPTQNFALSNPFFYSPIKRRIAMLTNAQKTRFTYARRLVILPLLALVVVLFAFRKKEVGVNNISLATTIDKVVGAVENTFTANANTKDFFYSKNYRVIIDAGHGGHDNGALAADGTTEKDMSLLIAQQIVKANTNKNIEFVLVRNTDVFQSPLDKVSFVNASNADALVTIHCNSSINTANKGLEIFIPTKKKTQTAETNLLASAIGKEVETFVQFNGVKQRNVGIWILDASNVPGVLVECGYLSNKEDVQQLKNKAYQQQLAAKIVSGIQLYLWQLDSKKQNIIDTAIKEASVTEMRFKPEGYEEIYLPEQFNLLMLEKGKCDVNGLIFVEGDNRKANRIEAFNRNSIATINLLHEAEAQKLFGKKQVIRIQLKESKLEKTVFSYIKDTLSLNPIFLLNGEEINPKDFDSKIAPNSIAFINVHRGKEAIKKFGQKGERGIVEIVLKGSPESLVKLPKYGELDEVVVEGYKKPTTAIQKEKVVMGYKINTLEEQEQKNKTNDTKNSQLLTEQVVEGYKKDLQKEKMVMGYKLNASNEPNVYGGQNKQSTYTIQKIEDIVSTNAIVERIIPLNSVRLYKKNDKSMLIKLDKQTFINKNIGIVYFIEYNASNNKLKIKLHNGNEEIYITNNQESVENAENKYGSLPLEYLPSTK